MRLPSSAAHARSPQRRARGRYLPVIRADLQLEQQYSPPAEPAAVPTLAFVGLKEGRDKEKSRVRAADAALWMEATRAPGSRVVELPDVDWYVLQEAAGAKAIMTEVCNETAANVSATPSHAHSLSPPFTRPVGEGIHERAQLRESHGRGGGRKASRNLRGRKSAANTVATSFRV